MQAVLTNPRTVLEAMELCARLNEEFDSSHRMFGRRARHDRLCVVRVAKLRRGR
jgi:hypothetical protein